MKQTLFEQNKFKIELQEKIDMIKQWQRECLEYEIEKNEARKREREQIDNDDVGSDGISEIELDEEMEEKFSDEQKQIKEYELKELINKMKEEMKKER